MLCLVRDQVGVEEVFFSWEFNPVTVVDILVVLICTVRVAIWLAWCSFRNPHASARERAFASFVTKCTSDITLKHQRRAQNFLFVIMVRKIFIYSLKFACHFIGLRFLPQTIPHTNQVISILHAWSNVEKITIGDLLISCRACVGTALVVLLHALLPIF